MDSGGGGDEDFAEVFASIRRMLNSPGESGKSQLPQTAELPEPFDLPNFLRTPPPPSPSPDLLAPRPVSLSPLSEDRIQSPPSRDEDESPGDADELPRSMCFCRDTVIAEMGESRGPRQAPWSDLQQQTPEAPEGPAQALSERSKDTLSSRIDAAVRGGGMPAEWPEMSVFGLGLWRDQGDMKPALVLDPDLLVAEVEETAALLRPILREWVQDNMRQALVRALQVEANSRSRA